MSHAVVVLPAGVGAGGISPAQAKAAKYGNIYFIKALYCWLYCLNIYNEHELFCMPTGFS